MELWLIGVLNNNDLNVLRHTIKVGNTLNLWRDFLKMAIQSIENLYSIANLLKNGISS